MSFNNNDRQSESRLRIAQIQDNMLFGRTRGRDVYITFDAVDQVKNVLMF